MVGKEIFVFDGNGSLGDVVRQVGQLNGSAILISVDFVEQRSVTIKDLSRDGEGTGAEFGGGRQVF